MLREGLCSVVGFEPQPDALAELQQRRGPLETYLPDAVGDGREHSLRVTAVSGMTSVLAPDPRRLAQFNGFTEWGAVQATQRIATRRLDEIDAVEHIDFLKIDVQGAELLVFEGARKKLSETVAIQTEVSFVPLYQGQPTFGDVDRDLRARGFVPHTFAAIKRWAIAPVIFGGDFRVPGNQLLEADVVYVRDFAFPERLTDEQLRHLGLIAHHVYGSVDLAHRCLAVLAQRGAVEADVPGRYLASQ
jgi:FkbM family methyltransferase